ncbi:hypothetical protein S245_043158, partial [Arachis hypogaea]
VESHKPFKDCDQQCHQIELLLFLLIIIIINLNNHHLLSLLLLHQSHKYTNKITLFLFLLHMLIAIALVAFLIFKGVEGLIQPSSDSKRRKQTRVV